MGNIIYSIQGPTHMPPGDPHTLLLLHGDSIVDNSRYKVPLTNQGVVVSTAQSKFGGKSLYFDGTQHIEISRNNCPIDFNSDFTLDWWEYRLPDCKGPVLYMPNANYGLVVFDTPSDSYRTFGGNTGWTWVKPDAIANAYRNSWNHIAVVKNGDIITYFLNGKSEKSVRTSGTLELKNVLFVGQRTGQYATAFKGYIDEFRISDIARWGANFTPPDKPY